MVGVEGTRVVPWADWSEWLELRQLLSKGETEQAFQRVAMYRIRRRGAVPITILTTVTLVKQLEQPVPDAYLQRLALSMTLTRFVNGTTDRLQPRGEGSTARSVYSLAKELQLPLILVEIRHQASHNVLPRLSTLTSGAKEALKWLEDFYWVPQEKNIPRNEIQDLLAIRSVFERVSNFETSHKSLPFEVTDGPADFQGSQNTGESRVLERLRKATAVLGVKKRKQKEYEDANEVLLGEHWTLCDDQDAWKVMPLGLIPGQTKVPRSKISSCLQKRQGNAEASNENSDYGEPSNEETSKMEETHMMSNDIVALKKRRALTTAQESFVQKKVAEFRRLAEAARSDKPEGQKDRAQERSNREVAT